MSRLLVRNGVFSRGPFRGGLGEDLAPPAPPTDSEVISTIDQRTKEILKRLDDDVRARKYALIIGGVSALFAAVKLGIIAFPALRTRVGGG